MSDVHLAAILALCAALASAIGNVVRQRSAQEVTDRRVGHLTLFGMLLRDTRWWLGGLGDIGSYVLLAAALDKGSVLLVMSLQVTALLFALPIYARMSHHPITRREWTWALLLAVALAVLIAIGDPTGGQQRAPLQTWLVVAAVIGPLLLLGLLGARIWVDRPVAALLLAAVAGSLLAVFAVLMKGVVDILERHPGQVWQSFELYALVGCGVAGMIYHQSAYRAGALTASLPTIIVAKPVVGGILGIVVLGETLAAGGWEWFVLAVTAVVVIVATVGLARGEAATVSAGAGRDVKSNERPTAATQA
ncbi:MULTISPECIES: DMT family transporter [Mycobacterium]|jgi:drug/metabolite transporter (DMT)-like permease|uniref:Dehydrogenase n=6 Tax=Mycobacterium avium complex (MAC) TaxID=120793 RepID=A0A7R7MWY8_MYCIT|nr:MULTISPECIES: DMT family transporter [Mycobacterium]EUA56151.1 putative membrane protein [Mycobacterium intracellulare 1956]AFC45182.1 dehydrogenase [Mycobacterium intracellulare ATCC 13950]AFC50322.1 dehydrogenase [Mycobacterium intracellulare MOTT-02]AFC55594.1 dehydrogenase [Mycobacterium paraintracellulare]AFS16029.1 Dehydrogenase [Mycobacterium intracellulare subsp. intracellulare MTCC 9506]